MMRVMLIIACSLVSAVLGAAPNPAPWTSDGTFEIPLNDVDISRQFEAEGVVMTAEILAVGIPGDNLCGEVQIFVLPDDREIPPGSPDWTLKPVSEAQCAPPTSSKDLFGARLALENDLLIVSDLVHVGGDSSDNAVHVFRAVRDGGDLSGWERLDVLTAEDSEVEFFGDQIATNGDAIFVYGLEDAEVMFNRYDGTATISIFSTTDDGLFSLVNQVQFDGEAAFELAGDQLMVLTETPSELGARANQLRVLNYDSDSHAVTPVQVIHLPVDKRGQLIDVSGRFMVNAFGYTVGVNAGGARIEVFERSEQFQWELVQEIREIRSSGLDACNGICPDRRVSFDIEGSDLMVNWFDGLDFEGGDDTNTFQYRLGEDGNFNLFGEIETAPPTVFDDRFGWPWEPIRRIYSNGRRFAVLNDTTAVNSLQIELFSRPIGNHFLIDRGISGGWSFGPERNGQGLFIEVLGPVERPRVLIHWDTHDNAGRQMWLRGVGEIDFDRVRMQLRQPEGGRFGPDFNPSQVNKTDWGEIELVFETCERGMLHYDSERFGSGSLPLRRVSRIAGLDCGDALASDTASRWSGSWADPELNGQGLMLQVAGTRVGPVLTASWNTYDTEGNQVWLYADERIDPETEVINATRVSRPANMTFDGSLDAEDKVVTDWGHYTLERIDCNTLLLSYAFDAVGNGSGVQRLERLTTPLGMQCVDE